MKKSVLYGWKNETMEEKIKKMLALSLRERHEAGIATGELAKILKKNQEKQYEARLSRTVQILKKT